MKLILSLLVACALALGAFAQDDAETTRFAYVKASGVNLRSKPSPTSTVVGKADQGNIYLVSESNGDWLLVEDSNGPESDYYWISSKFVDILNYDLFPEEKLNSTYEFDDGVNFGMLEFQKNGVDEYGNTVVEYSYMVKNRELQESGGNGVVLNEAGKMLYLGGGTLTAPEGWEDYPLVFDKKQGKLYFCGLLWQAE